MDDPKKPWKAVVAAVVAAASVLLAEWQDVLPAWLLVVLMALVGGGTTYAVRNPPVPPA